MLQNCYFIRTFIEIPSNSLFSRNTRNQILNIKLIIITTIIMMILISIMYFTTLEHLKAGIKGEELLLPRHTVIWMCLWAKQTLIWLSQKLELYRFHFHFCKLANNLTSFVNKYTKKLINNFFQWINRQWIKWAYRRYNAQYCFKHQIWKVKNEANCKGTRRIFIYYTKVCFFQRSSSILYCLNYLHLHKGWSEVI